MVLKKELKLFPTLSSRLLTINSSEIFLMPQGVNFMENLKIPNGTLVKDILTKSFT